MSTAVVIEKEVSRLVWIQHFIFGFSFILLNSFINFSLYPFKAGLIRLLFMFLLNGSIYLLFYKVLIDDFFEKKKYLLFSLIIAGILLVSSVIRIKVESLLYHYFMPPLSIGHYPGNLFLVIVVMTQGIVIFISSLMAISKNKFIADRILLNMSRTKTETELSLLKAKINPHFLFNTLNNIYYYSREEESRSSQAILQLSHLLQYTIYETSLPKIPLRREMEVVEGLVRLYRLRYSDEQELRINILKEAIDTVEIPPAIILILVENALKYSGIGTEDNSFIELEVKVQNGQLFIDVRNSIIPVHETVLSTYSGMGHSSLRRILEMEYSGRYDFKIISTSAMYHARLKIIV